MVAFAHALGDVDGGVDSGGLADGVTRAHPCTTCGAELLAEELRQPTCPHCGATQAQYAPPIYPTPYAPFNVNDVASVMGKAPERSVARSLSIVVITAGIALFVMASVGVAAFLLSRK